MMFVVLLFIAVVVACAVMKLTSSIILPIVVSMLLSLVFEPIVVALKTKLRLPWGIGIALVILFVLVVLTAVFALLFSSASTIVSVYPRYEARFLTVYRAIAEFFEFSFDADASLFDNLWNQLSIRSFIQSSIYSFSSGLAELGKNFILVMLFVIFFMIEIRTFRDKMSLAFPGAGEGKVTRIINDIISQVTRYMSIKFFISLLTGVCVFAGTFLLGMDFTIIWGFLAFVLNFIPNFGSIFSGIITVGFSVIQFWPQPANMVITGILMLGVNTILGNVIEPRVQGINLGLSPFLILTSLAFWGWIWGFAGLILAVPMMAIIKIVCDNVEMLKPISILMGATRAEVKAAEQSDAQEKTTENISPND
jgi:predicted PurR-regulated permease PerM